MIVVVVIGAVLLLYGIARILNIGGISTKTLERAKAIEERRRQQGGPPQEVPEDLAKWLGWAFGVVGAILLLVGLFAL